MTNHKKEILKDKKEYYVNFNHKFFIGLTRTQVAFIFLISKLNKANLVASNAEIAASLKLKGFNKGDYSGVPKLIERINDKFPNLIKRDFNTRVDHLGRIKVTDKSFYSVSRNIILTRELYIKGETYINLPSFVTSKKSCFLSSNELAVLAYLKSMPERRFTGLLRVMAAKLTLSLAIIKRALQRLQSIKAINKTWMLIKHRLKNVKYSILSLNVNTEWRYELNPIDKTLDIKKKVHDGILQEESWDDLINLLGRNL